MYGGRGKSFHTFRIWRIFGVFFVGVYTDNEYNKGSKWDLDRIVWTHSL